MDTPTLPGDERQSLIEDFYLLQRLAIGIVILGGSELIERLQSWQQMIDADPERVWLVKDFDDETTLDELVYFILGSLLRLERSGVSLALTGIKVVQQTAQTAANILHPLLDNPLTRPFQRPFNSIFNKFDYQIQRSIRDGRSEDRRGRALAQATFEELMDEVIDVLARNPEVIGLIRQQSTGLANVVLDNGRGLIVSADTLVEAISRRLLRMTPRAELPESPLAGKSQEMDSMVGTDR